MVIRQESDYPTVQVRVGVWRVVTIAVAAESIVAYHYSLFMKKKQTLKNLSKDT